MTTPDPNRAPRAAPFLVGHRTRTPDIASRYLAAGATYLELDVRVVDGRVITTHYQPVGRSRGRLERDNARFRRRRLPPRDATVAELLDGLPAGVRILLDPKDRDPDLRALVDGVVTAVDDPGRHVVSTRNRRDLEWFGAAGFRTWWTLDTPEQIRAAVAAGPLPCDGVSVRHRSLTAESVRSLHTVTDTVVAWTVRSAARAHELVVFGVDGLTTHSLEVMATVRR